MSCTGITLSTEGGERIYVDLESINSVEEVKGLYDRAPFCKVLVSGKCYHVRESFTHITTQIQKAKGEKQER